MEWILFSAPIGLALGIAAIAATICESDRYFNEQPSWGRIGSYRIPYVMMIGVGLGFVPVFGIAYALTMWAVYFSGKRFG